MRRRCSASHRFLLCYGVASLKARAEWEAENKAAAMIAPNASATTSGNFNKRKKEDPHGALGFRFYGIVGVAPVSIQAVYIVDLVPPPFLPSLFGWRGRNTEGTSLTCTKTPPCRGCWFTSSRKETTRWGRRWVRWPRQGSEQS
jgi:hypothetical protein